MHKELFITPEKMVNQKVYQDVTPVVHCHT